MSNNPIVSLVYSVVNLDSLLFISRTYADNDEVVVLMMICAGNSFNRAPSRRIHTERCSNFGSFRASLYAVLDCVIERILHSCAKVTKRIPPDGGTGGARLAYCDRML